MHRRLAAQAVCTWLLLTSGCGSSEEEIQAEFDRLVARSNACQSADECVIVSPGCPLGCFVAVNRDHQSKVAQEANELIADYERGGTSCAYDCATLDEVSCTEGRCVATIQH